MSSTTFVPEWAKRAVWYQIFPDRFCNGDPANDPTLESQVHSYPHDYSFPWRVHPWTSDWYELQPYERASGLDLWKCLQRRRYGGDLQGVLDKLDYLQDLGVTALYLNPIFDAASLHKYDGNTYHHVDVHFGPDPVGDRRLIAAEIPDDPRTWVWTAADRLFLKLVAEVHRRGMRIVIDGVFNHLGLSSFPFRDLVAKGRASRFKDWFKVTDWDTPSRFAPFTYAGWFGVPELPELNQDAGGHVAGPKEYIFACTRRWQTPAAWPEGLPAELAGGGIDGWRLDVAFCIRHGFWKDWRRLVKALNPEAYLFAEIVLEDEDEPYLRGDEFDGVMNYRWFFACAEFFAGALRRTTVSEFDRRLRELREAHPAGVAHGQYNLLDSHDTTRITSFLANRSTDYFTTWFRDYQGKASPSITPAYITRRPGPEERALHRLMVLFQMTYVGAPVVYYGDEAGLWGANDPCCRKPMVWPELTYAPEAVGPDGARYAAPDAVAFDHDLFAYHRRLIALRHSLPALQLGDYRTLLADDAAGVLAFERARDAERVVVVINTHPVAQAVSLPLAGAWTDVFNGGRAYTAAAGSLAVEAPAFSGCILKAAA